VRPVDTRKVRRALEQLGCTLVGTKGDHEKWRTPNGLTTTIVAAEKQQSPGLLRSVQRVFEPEFGEGWLEKEVGS
jgi:predicted RNA binding protein YcfA (HicA-like mRNA interferase family)